jgi:hypothetical protein
LAAGRCGSGADQWLHRCHYHYRPSDNKQDAMEILNTTDGWFTGDRIARRHP